MSNEVSLCIHGHFYQPPRENAWIEDVESQDSASPYHDWNERILHECYLPNSESRIFDNRHRIVSIVNNYEKLSFNFGPTLLVWMKSKFPKTYARILEADRVSIKEHRGHGNAIAQVFNHMIMPLANRRDKVTQVLWGIEDFKDRFSREPESVWLSETACNEETLEVLVEAGMKYVILEPHQAEEVRPLDGNEWKSVGDGSIDPREPYRCFLKKDPSKYIDIFFYDGPISKAVGFESIAQNAHEFMDRVEGALNKHAGRPQLLSVATDGETYGHHKAFGDRTLAYLTRSEAERRGIRIVNYGEYLAENPPRMAVRIKEGESGQGTSWSCAHGVRRWWDNCGCRGDGPADWNQEWRRPLRNSLDWLRDELARIYEYRAGSIFKDAWGARDRYIQVVLHRNEKTVEEYFARECFRELTAAEKLIAMKLLEMQRFAMLMYTSCGWFFTELSGIETVQILQYAARAIQLAKETSHEDLEGQFLDRLSLAKSNVAFFRDGRGIYDTVVKPTVSTLRHVAAFYAIGSLFEEYFQFTDEEMRIHCFNVEILHHRSEKLGGIHLGFGRVNIFSRVTREFEDLVFVVTQLGPFDFRCSVKPFIGLDEMESLEDELFSDARNLHMVDLMRKIDSIFGEAYFALKNLLREDRIRITNLLARETLDRANQIYDKLYEENRLINEAFRSVNLPLPMEFKYSAENALNRRAREALDLLAEKNFSVQKARAFYHIFEDAEAIGVEIHKEPLAFFLDEELGKRLANFTKTNQPELIEESQNILKIAKRSQIELEMRKAQGLLFKILTDWQSGKTRIPSNFEEYKEKLAILIRDLRFNPQIFKSITAAHTDDTEEMIPRASGDASQQDA
jgi:alpha-amylase/alpha-mannosidase (GH57 family)